MENSDYKYNFKELLCLKKFSDTFNVFSSDEFCQAVVCWAEREVIAGADSETLLIIASLGLDSKIDSYEVEKYLLIYKKELSFQEPSERYSALVWLRVQLEKLIAASSAQEVECRLSFFTHYFLDYPPRAFACITYTLSNLYWELYDEAIPVFSSRASEMSEDQLLAHIKERLFPFYRILSNPDWIQVLASSSDSMASQ
ncbi:hypothetical protein ABR39_10000 [Enterobacter genomosp. O]|uniref:hypothetical protein n=1 Tax=Enterobacter genomosp. O TaxID=2364150 RepID=UPI000643AB24|nr:hypothetical protein [Enterobacter genomosp. O]KLP55229.1 hypothetical protein ABR39_10000 [Enterobacter genomosp. O]